MNKVVFTGLVLIAILVGFIAFNRFAVAPATIPSSEANRLWGQLTDELQLSLDIEPTSGKPADLELSFAARNVGVDAIRFDAKLPSTNDSKLLIVDPDGMRRTINVQDDQKHTLEIQPGGSILGKEKDIPLAGSQYSTLWFPRGETLRGNYALTWQLGEVKSNTIFFSVQ